MPHPILGPPRAVHAHCILRGGFLWECNERLLTIARSIRSDSDLLHRFLALLYCYFTGPPASALLSPPLIRDSALASASLSPLLRRDSSSPTLSHQHHACVLSISMPGPVHNGGNSTVTSLFDGKFRKMDDSIGGGYYSCVGERNRGHGFISDSEYMIVVGRSGNETMVSQEFCHAQGMPDCMRKKDRNMAPLLGWFIGCAVEKREARRKPDDGVLRSSQAARAQDPHEPRRWGQWCHRTKFRRSENIFPLDEYILNPRSHQLRTDKLSATGIAFEGCPVFGQVEIALIYIPVEDGDLVDAAVASHWNAKTIMSNFKTMLNILMSRAWTLFHALDEYETSAHLTVDDLSVGAQPYVRRALRYTYDPLPTLPSDVVLPPEARFTERELTDWAVRSTRCLWRQMQVMTTTRIEKWLATV
ncbi:uncharacterized protein B0H18DRAFT_1125761 [Fomitopsis serialis]|uniref:uncharacterized protein n=1 Tax=Fomitopsis serialis TaxID=139415 RepID=UPI002007565B|nr:uncharacterized protein B0H18DRAFT_1126739 [Neoantrodia serialis]XP_047886431.1 uncharacterized protein B0H18DRAFT_1125761 [Neoantrodia serialis]KAH9912829.1 hypothetical protein B0H18DRAFT_1126739 [Neoantrodia serialis]KAH9914242.1 hypothetical protein B0H18DRAFT_1125761 [Neoantrodia serialis]